MDGVLADTERDAHRPAFNRVFDEQGLDTEWTVERYGRLLETGGGKERMTAHWNEVGWPESMKYMSDEERRDMVKELHRKKTDVFMESINRGDVPLRPGVLRVIDDAIDAGLTLAVCSTSSELAVRNLVHSESLCETSIAHLPHAVSDDGSLRAFLVSFVSFHSAALMGPDRAARFSIFAGDMVAKKKPAPDVYLMAVDALGLSKDGCVVVEDSAIGLGAARAAGITCLVTKSSYTAGEDFTGADKIVDELGDDPATGVTLQTLDDMLRAKNK
jgi:beta-phosphoglucomutase-like phosphatase (HAD superfamily)